MLLLWWAALFLGVGGQGVTEVVVGAFLGGQGCSAVPAQGSQGRPGSQRGGRRTGPSSLAGQSPPPPTRPTVDATSCRALSQPLPALHFRAGLRCEANSPNAVQAGLGPSGRAGVGSGWKRGSRLRCPRLDLCHEDPADCPPEGHWRRPVCVQPRSAGGSRSPFVAVTSLKRPNPG